MLKALLLCAGEGTRLRPLTETLPKPMIPLLGVPLLARTRDLLVRHGINEIAVNLHHRAHRIPEHFGASLTYSQEETLRGTAGALGPLRAWLDTTFLVLYGDNLYDIDLQPLLAFHRERGALATIATFTTDRPTACGLVGSLPDGTITRFVEKPAPEAVFTDQANAGIYVLEPELLAALPETIPYDFGHDWFPQLLQTFPGRLLAHPLSGTLQDTGTPEGYRRAVWHLIDAGEPAIAASAQLDQTAQLIGRNAIGANCRIGAGAVLRECLLWDDVQVGAGARLSGCILGNGVHVPAGATLTDGSLIASRTRL